MSDTLITHCSVEDYKKIVIVKNWLNPIEHCYFLKPFNIDYDLAKGYGMRTIFNKNILDNSPNGNVERLQSLLIPLKDINGNIVSILHIPTYYPQKQYISRSCYL
ncbi:hypothetical protein ABK040_014911 [Willaertia magna]